jgi:hypothetical protein
MITKKELMYRILELEAISLRHEDDIEYLLNKIKELEKPKTKKKAK